ncbi:MAG: hypothetical protein LBR89_04685 [Holosporales bacterium]|jgi:hypothetical protein|nr:hypothetical protein [Holosporales bacterium]
MNTKFCINPVLLLVLLWMKGPPLLTDYLHKVGLCSPNPAVLIRRDDRRSQTSFYAGTRVFLATKANPRK